MAQSYQKSGDNANAIIWYQKIIDAFPGTSYASDAKDYMTAIGGTPTQTSAGQESGEDASTPADEGQPQEDAAGQADEGQEDGGEGGTDPGNTDDGQDDNSGEDNNGNGYSDGGDNQDGWEDTGEE